MYFEARPGIFPAHCDPDTLHPESEHPKGTDAVPIEAIFQLNHAKSVGGDCLFDHFDAAFRLVFDSRFSPFEAFGIGANILVDVKFHHHPLIIRIPGNRTTRESSVDRCIDREEIIQERTKVLEYRHGK